MRVSYRCHRSQDMGIVFEQTGPIKFCCADMQKFWGNLIGFGVKGIPFTSNRNVNLLTVHQEATGTIIPSVADIQFCPWCAERIAVVQTKKRR